MPFTAQDILNSVSSFGKQAGITLGKVGTAIKERVTAPRESIGKPLAPGPILPQLGQRLQETGRQFTEPVRKVAEPIIQDFQQRVPRFQERVIEPVKREVGQFREFAQGIGPRAERFKETPIAKTTPEEMAFTFAPGGVKGAFKPIQGGGGVFSKIGGFFKNLGQREKLLEIGTEGEFKKSNVGRQLLTSLEKVFDRSQRLQGQTINQFQKDLGKVSDDVFAQALDFREGLIKSVDPTVKSIARRLDNVFKPFADLAQKAGLEIRDPRTGIGKPWQPLKGYVPHMVDVDKLKVNRDFVIDHLVKTKQLNKGSATSLVNSLIEGENLGTATRRFIPTTTPDYYGNLEFARILDFPKEVLLRNKSLIARYVREASERIAQAEEFGAVNQKLESFIGKSGKIEREALNPNKIRTITLRQLGMEARDIPQGWQKAVNPENIRTWEAVMKLGTAAISNITQSINTATSYGIGPTVRAIYQDLFKRGQSRDFAMNAGTIVESAIRDFMQETVGRGGKIVGKIMAPGFKSVETFNRAVSTNAGKFYAVDQFQKLLKNPNNKDAIKVLTKLGINVDEVLKNKTLSDDDLIKAGRAATKTTQFLVRPLDLPGFATTPWGRVAVQFKTFIAKQTEFIANEVLLPATKGNLAPLIKFTVLTTLAGELVGGAKAFISGRERPSLEEDPWGRLADAMTSAGAASIPTDLVRAANAGKFGLMQWIIGPTGSDIAEIGSAILPLPTPSLGKAITRKIPILGPRISKEFFPTEEEERKRGGSTFRVSP